jgi:hypothetical protein
LSRSYRHVTTAGAGALQDFRHSRPSRLRFSADHRFLSRPGNPITRKSLASSPPQDPGCDHRIGSPALWQCRRGTSPISSANVPGDYVRSAASVSLSSRALPFVPLARLGPVIRWPNHPEQPQCLPPTPAGIPERPAVRRDLASKPSSHGWSWPRRRPPARQPTSPSSEIA